MTWDENVGSGREALGMGVSCDLHAKAGGGGWGLTVWAGKRYWRKDEGQKRPEEKAGTHLMMAELREAETRMMRKERMRPWGGNHGGLGLETLLRKVPRPYSPILVPHLPDSKPIGLNSESTTCL